MSIFPFHMHTIWWLRMPEYWILLTFRGRRRVNTILTLITLDYRQTINITAAWFVLPANAKTAYIYEMSACYSAQNKCNHTNRTRCIHTHTQSSAIEMVCVSLFAYTHENNCCSSCVMEFFIGNNFNDNNILMHLDLLTRYISRVSVPVFHIIFRSLTHAK